jgi:ornithine cyclodeaminase/alanine dehydrogenase-like protein (mu-crystallin family)
MRLLSADQVSRLLPMDVAIDLMREAFAALSHGEAVMPDRIQVDAPGGNILFMPAYLPGKALSMKAVSTYATNHARGIPTIQGLVVAFDEATGSPTGVLDARSITALRTGAAGGLAVDLLARPDARSLALIGCGVQGGKQIQAISCVREIDHIRLFDQDRQMAESLADQIARSGQPRECLICGSADKAVEEADIVITATPSPTPTFDSRRLEPGTHVTAIGSFQPHTQEIDAALVRRSYVVVEHAASAWREAGDLIKAGKQPDAELGQIVSGDADGRQDDQQMTVFKSVGVAIQDTAAATWVLQRAEQQGIGTLVDL